MAEIFVFGTLVHDPLREVVLDGPCETLPAFLPDHQARSVAGADFPALVESPGDRAEGLMLLGLDKTRIARLDYYEGPFGYVRETVTVTTENGPRRAEFYRAPPGRLKTAGPWDIETWARDWGALTTLAAREYMDGFASIPEDEAARRVPQMRQRAWSALRAGAKRTPSRVRSHAGARSVDVVARRRPYSNFFTAEERDLRFPRFDGSMSAQVTRAGFVAGDAVTVLPYDPGRDRVLLIEQFRFGPFLRGDPQPWVLEPVAGRIDPGETARDAALRELREEAGLEAQDLLHVAEFYPSPGAWTEYLVSYVAIADLPDGVAGINGVAEEAEDIRSHVLTFAAAMELVRSGEAETAPLIMTLLWLEGRRAGLAAGA